jgi:hypothetical protein
MSRMSRRLFESLATVLLVLCGAPTFTWMRSRPCPSRLPATSGATGSATEVRKLLERAITGLVPGTFHVRHNPPAGWRGTVPATGSYTITVTAGQVVGGKDFGDTQKAFIGGTVFNDANGNGKKDTAEKGLSAWRVFIDANKDGVWEGSEQSALTDASGDWAFSNLAPGTYMIRIVQQAGFTRTTPSSGNFTISALGGYNSGYLFGERS